MHGRHPELRPIDQHIALLQQRLDTLQRCVAVAPGQAAEVLPEALEELRTALEELHVADEELRQQNNALAAARHSAEAERQRYQELFDLAPDGYLVTDTAGVIQEANQAAVALLDRAPDFLVGKPLVLFVAAPERPAFRTRLQDLRRLEGVQDWDVALQPTGRRPFPAALTVVVIRDRQGHPRGLRWLLRDITARKQAEEALQTSELRLRLALECGQMGTCSWDVRTDAVDFDAGVLALLGLPLTATLPTLDAFLARVHPDDRPALRQALDAVRRDPGDYTGEFRIVRPDGEIRWLASQGRLRRDVQGQPTQLIGIDFDITGRKQAEATLQAAKATLEERAAALQEANADILRFANIVSHDLRAPLTNLKGFSGELREACAELTQALAPALPHVDASHQAAVTRMLAQDIPEALGFIDASVTRMDRLIQAILRLARLGRQELQFESVATADLVQETLQTLAHQIAARQVRVSVGALPVMWADRTALAQIFGNLLSNAVAYLEPGRPGVITVTAEARPGATAFQVQDNGRGIATEDIPRVFEVFQRVGRQDVAGEGMGLAYVQRLVRRHGGEITCQSELGVGTVFTFTIAHHLPRSAGADEKPAPPPSPAPAGESPVSAPTPARALAFLLVEDDRGQARGQARLLERDGHTVDLAANGRLALEHLAARAYDAVLSDLRLPELDGAGLYRAIARRHPHLCGRVLFLTGEPLSPEVQGLLAAVGAPCLTKPFTGAALRQALAQLLGQA